MDRSFKLFVVALLLVLPACYHATIETGLPAGNDIIDQSFASSWIYGLVPPKPVSTMAKCPSGVSKVETKLSFLNQLVGALTLGIYTPMAVKVTCASRGQSAVPGTPEIQVGGHPTEEQVIDAFRRAADLSVESGGAVYVRF